MWYFTVTVTHHEALEGARGQTELLESQHLRAGQRPRRPGQFAVFLAGAADHQQFSAGRDEACQRGERAFLFGLIALLLATGVGPGPWLDLLLPAACALGVLTIVKRARGALREGP